MPTIVIPFRGGDAKRRLALKPDAARLRLAEAMLADVLAAARAVGEPVVAYGDGGQGAAVAAALATASLGPCLVVNADLPCVTPDDLQSLLRAIPCDGIAVAAAADGTTNALGLARASLFEPLYGAGSAARFVALATSVRFDTPNLADDVDTLADLARLGDRLGPHTRAALRHQAAA